MPVLSRLLDAGRSGHRTAAKRTGRAAEALHGMVVTPVRVRSAPRRHGPRPARAISSPASYPSPTDPALRANPFPEVTDPICRLPLPTLFYRQRLFTLETCCGYGYGLARESHLLTRIFKGRRECTGHRGKRGALRRQRPSLRASRFQGVRALQRKDNSSRGSRRRLLVRLRCRTGPPQEGSVSVARFGNINPIPFR